MTRMLKYRFRINFIFKYTEYAHVFLQRMWNGGMANIGGRGRGSSVDRGGRGRSGRGSLYSSHYSRGVGFDDSGDGIRIEGQSFQV